MGFKKFSLSPPNGQWGLLYTVPAGKTAIIKQLHAVPEINGLLNHNARIKINETIISSGNSVATTGSNLLLNDFVALNEGDKVYVQTEKPFSSIIKSQLPASIMAMMLNDAGTTIIVYVQGYGIYRSTDDAVTWTKVYDDNSLLASWAYIAGNFFFYKKDGTTLKSINDGITWTSHVYANTPICPNSSSCLSPSGRISKNASGVYAGLIGTQQATYTTDGITWTVSPDNLPSGYATGIIWSGNKWIMSAVSSGSAAYYKMNLNDASWTALSSVNSLSFNNISCDSEGINSSTGKLIAVTTTPSLFYSSNGGGTWNQLPTVTINNQTVFLFTPTMVLGCGDNAGTVYYYLTNKPIPDTVSNIRLHNLTYLGTYIRNNKVYGIQYNSVWKSAGLDLINQRNFGLTFFMSVAEI